MMKKRKVILRRCDDYNVTKIMRIIKEGIMELNEQPHGKILIKPNVVMASEAVHTAHTSTHMVEAMVRVLREIKPDAEVSVGKSGGMAIPTRLFFKHSGYSEMAKRLGVPLRDFNEERQVKVSLSRAKWHKEMWCAKSLYEANYKIYMTKLKYHNGCSMTNALKLNIGILTHKERMLYHNDRLDEKMIDLLEVGYPDLVVTDAIEIGHGHEFGPYLHHLGAILIANDPLAADMVAACILNFQPTDVKHIVEASERGYGSLSFDDIEVTGDVSIDELSANTKKITSAFGLRWQGENIDWLPVKIYVGINRERGRKCSAGCLNAFTGALANTELYWPGTMSKIPKSAVVIGYYEGDVIHPGEKVALIGDCTGIAGKIEAQKVIRFKGCPMKGVDQAMFLFPRLGIPTPAYKFSTISGFAYHSAIKGLMYALKPFKEKIGDPGNRSLQRVD